MFGSRRNSYWGSAWIYNYGFHGTELDDFSRYIIDPTFDLWFLFFNAQFPKTERVTSGVSYRDMIKNCFQPLLFSC